MEQMKKINFERGTIMICDQFRYGRLKSWSIWFLQKRTQHKNYKIVDSRSQVELQCLQVICNFNSCRKEAWKAKFRVKWHSNPYFINTNHQKPEFSQAFYMQLLTLQLTSKDKLLAGQINHSWNCAYILGNMNGQPSDILVHAVIFARCLLP